MWLAEEDVGDGESGDDTDEVGNEATYDGRAGVLNTHATKLNS